MVYHFLTKRMIHHFRIYLRTRNLWVLNEIRRKFKIDVITVNYEAEFVCDEDTAVLVRECEKRGFLIIRQEKYGSKD